MSVFARFVPGTARAVVDDDGPALLSGQLLARLAAKLDAPIVELTATKAASLVGFLRACKHEDAVAVVSVDAAVRHRSPQAPSLCRDGVLAAAAAAGFTGPMVLVARGDVVVRATTLVPEPEPNTRLRERIARDVAAGYTSIGVSAHALRDASEWARVAPLFAELDLGLELEIDGDDDAALLLAQLDDLQLPISAVRGANPFDEVGNAVLVVDARHLVKGLPAALRVTIDALVDQTGTDDDVEARAWMATTRVLRKLGGRDTATRLEDALAEMLG